MKLALIGALALFAGPSLADEYWEFGAWRVVVSDVDTGEEVRRTCRASTGGDGDPTLTITISDGDAGPPFGFPSTIFVERAPRGFETTMQDQDGARIVFDDNSRVTGRVLAYRDPEGFAVAEVFFDQPSAQIALRKMRANARFKVRSNGNLLLKGSLDGFSASYLKVVDECGFTGEGVLD